MDFIAELRWRGMIQEITPGLEEHLKTNTITGYIGFDPSASSLHLGNLATIMLLIHLQRAGHKPIALVGGATGMIGDPSGKSAERNLLDEASIRANVEGIQKQLMQFLDFTPGPKGAEVVNNLDWFGPMKTIDFLRKIGKHLTVNYMMAKDSVQNRMETGISFTEFSYQLLQGYDYQWLFENKGCRLQMGGSDQWGNITSGTELIRRMGGKEEAYALTTPLLTKSDGSKFGKSESGNIWLDPERTSPYQFYQFLLNQTDEDSPKLLRRLTFMDQKTIENLESEHAQNPGMRLAQKKLAEEVTQMVHGVDGLKTAKLTTEVLFGKGRMEELEQISESQFDQVFAGVPKGKIQFSEDLKDWVGLLSVGCRELVFPSKSEARKMIQSNAIQINQTKINLDSSIDIAPLRGKFYLVQKGKKQYYLLEKAN